MSAEPHTLSADCWCNPTVQTVEAATTQPPRHWTDDPTRAEWIRHLASMIAPPDRVVSVWGDNTNTRTRGEVDASDLHLLIDRLLFMTALPVNGGPQSSVGIPVAETAVESPPSSLGGELPDIDMSHWATHKSRTETCDVNHCLNLATFCAVGESGDLWLCDDHRVYRNRLEPEDLRAGEQPHRSDYFPPYVLGDDK